MSCDPNPNADAQTDLNTPVTPPTPPVTVNQSLDQIRPLCDAGLSPTLISGILMRILADHFSNPALIMEPELKQFVWTPDARTTKLRIATNVRFDPTAEGIFPALIVKRGPLQSDRKVVGDRVGVISQADAATGTVTYSRFVTGTHRIFAMATADGEAELLALEVFDTLTFLAPAIMERLLFHDFQAVALGELGTLEALGNKIGVPIDVRYTFEYSWAVREIAPLLKTLELRQDG